MEIGTHILAAIEKRGLNQARLAELLGKQPPAVSKWINNHNEPSYEDLITISAVTKISLDELLTGRPWAEPLNEAEQQAVDFVRANRLSKFQVLKVFSREVPPASESDAPPLYPPEYAPPPNAPPSKAPAKRA